MTSNTCDSGRYGCSCCCASVTGLRAGIHPDYIKSVAIDLIPDNTVKTISNVLAYEPLHIVSVTIALVARKMVEAGINPLETNAEIKAARAIRSASVYSLAGLGILFLMLLGADFLVQTT